MIGSVRTGPSPDVVLVNGSMPATFARGESSAYTASETIDAIRRRDVVQERGTNR